MHTDIHASRGFEHTIPVFKLAKKVHDSDSASIVIGSWRPIREWKYSSVIIDLGTRWRWVVSFTPRPLYPWGNSPTCPLYRRLDGPQNRSGSYEEEKNLAPAGNRTPTLQIVARRYTDWDIQFHMKQLHTLRWEKNEFLNLKTGVSYIFPLFWVHLAMKYYNVIHCQCLLNENENWPSGFICSNA
jgi:hypothetical protein